MVMAFFPIAGENDAMCARVIPSMVWTPTIPVTLDWSRRSIIISEIMNDSL